MLEMFSLELIWSSHLEKLFQRVNGIIIGVMQETADRVETTLECSHDFAYAMMKDSLNCHKV